MYSKIFIFLIVFSPLLSFGQSNNILDINKKNPKSSYDFSDISWTSAFDSMHAVLSLRYPFTNWKALDWNEKTINYRPDIIDAESANDTILFIETLYRYLYGIPDGHIELSGASSQYKYNKVGGSYGFNLLPKSDGSVLVSAIIENCEAWNGGLRSGDRIISWNDKKLEDITGLEWKCYARNYSTTEGRKFANYLMLTRDKPGDSAIVKYISNKSKNEATIKLHAFDDSFELFAIGLYNTASPLNFDSIVKYKILENEIGYLYIGAELCESIIPEEIMEHPDFIAVREALSYFNENNINKLIVDLRFNLGGNDMQAAVTMGLFYENQSFYEYITGSYDEDYEILYELYTEPLIPTYNGEIAVLVDQNCISTGEGLAMMFQRLPNASIIGNWGTNGAFGMMDYDPILLPAGLIVNFPQGMSLNIDKEIQIDSDSTLTGGVYPDRYVPVNATNMKKQWQEGIDVHIEYASSILLSAKDEEYENEYSIFPNPCTNYCNVTISNTNIKKANITLYSEKGILVLKQEVIVGESNIINLEKVLPGLYIYNLSLDSSKFTGKLLIN